MMSNHATFMSTFFALLAFATCQSSLEIDCTDIINFSKETFQKFTNCLCDADIGKCSTKFDQEYSDDRHLYNATNTVESEDTYFRSERYSHSYSCIWYRYRKYNTEIVCNRLLQREVNEPPTSDTTCQVLVLETLSLTCSFRSIYILWSNTQNVTKINPVTNSEDCGLCKPLISPALTTTATKSTTKLATALTTTLIKTSTRKQSQTTPSTIPAFEGQKGGNSDDDKIPLIVGVVVAVIVVLVIVGIIIVIWWRRKRDSKPPSTSHHYTTSTGAVSHNYENTRHGQEHVNGNGRSATNPYVIDESDSINATSPYQQAGQTVNGSYVSAEEVIQKKRAAAAAKNSDTNNQGTEYNSIDQDVPDAVVSPVNGLHNNDTRSAPPNPSSTTPVSTTYSRLGEPVRNIQNPYDALQNPDEYSVAKSTPASNNTSAQYSFAGPATSPSSTQDSETVHYSTSTSQPTNRNAYGYEEVAVNNMAAPVVSNDYEESPTQASGDNKDGAEAPKEPDYTNFPVKEPVAAKNDYAKLGEPVRNIQNSYDVMVNQKEDGPQESRSQAPPNSADGPYSLARPT